MKEPIKTNAEMCKKHHKKAVINDIKINLHKLMGDVKIIPGKEAFCLTCRTKRKLSEIRFLEDSNKQGVWSTCSHCLIKNIHKEWR